MGRSSGAYGAIDGIGNVRNWSVTDTRSPSSSRLSSSMGGAVRTQGPREWAGRFEVDDAIPPYMPGDTVAFQGYKGPTSGVYNSVGQAVTGNILISQLAMTIDKTSDADIRLAYTFVGDGPKTDTTATIVDATAKTLYPASATKLVTGSMLGVPNVDPFPFTTLTLTITNGVQDVIDASTANWKERSPGGIDWNLTVNVNEDDDAWNSSLTSGGLAELFLYVSATQFWHLAFARFNGWTDVQVDTETEAINSMTGNFEMHAFDSAGVLGTIYKPIALPGTASKWWGT